MASPKMRRASNLCYRIPETLKVLIERRAYEAGMTVSAWVRMQLYAACRQRVASRELAAVKRAKSAARAIY